jgi:hypothetical protein
LQIAPGDLVGIDMQTCEALDCLDAASHVGKIVIVALG